MVNPKAEKANVTVAEKPHKAGDIVVLKNGAHAEVQENGRWKFVKGPDPEHIPHRKQGDKVVYPQLSHMAAQRAFNSHYKKRQGSPRGNKQARTMDLNYKSPVRTDTRYRRSPHKYDYPGVDLGHKVRVRSAAQLRNDERLRREGLPAAAREARKSMKKGGADLKERFNERRDELMKKINEVTENEKKGGSPRGRPMGSHNKLQTECGFNDATKRCSKAHAGNKNEWCTVGRKSGRCKKSTLGKKESPKNQKNVERGESLMENLRSTHRVAHGRSPMKKTSAKSPKKTAVPAVKRVEPRKDFVEREVQQPKKGRPSKLYKATGQHKPALGLVADGSACSKLIEKDCNKHPACTFVEGKGKGSGCRRKANKDHVGGEYY